ncbi:hypothetical protein BC829DRAFT_56941 [Chytridium lagenaria]|nr:hypothetical protein BC829DRAFT_56941 [Chytridium lagenaria]
MLMAPMRRIFALGAGTAFINNRFPELEPLETNTSPTTSPFATATAGVKSIPYFPDQFIEAPKSVIPLVLKRLSGWDGSDAGAQQRRLQEMVQPSLYEKLRTAHKRLDDVGCTLNMSMEPELGTTRILGVWITFGAKTLQRQRFFVDLFRGGSHGSRLHGERRII